MTTDPIGLDRGLNAYGYAQGNPVRYTDPLGLWVKRGMRKLGSRENGNAGQNILFRHDYLNVSGTVLGFQTGDNVLWSRGRTDFDERTDRMRPLMCNDNEFDKYVFEAAGRLERQLTVLSPIRRLINTLLGQEIVRHGSMMYWS